MTFKIILSSGHGLKIRGARGNPVPPQVDEVDEARKIVEKVADYLDDLGIACETLHDDVSTTQSANLDWIVRHHNQFDSHDRLDVSVHLNCYDHSAHGTEVLYVTQEDLAAKVSLAIADAGDFYNRGAKYRGDLAFLNGTTGDRGAILIETFFCDHTGDCNQYHAAGTFDAICSSIANALVGEESPEEDRPADASERPRSIPVEDRPTLGRGDKGEDVLDLQRMIPRFSGEFDGDFGPTTEENVMRYQRSRGLAADGIVGLQTWKALYEFKLPVPPPPPPPGALTVAQQQAIMQIANESDIADYSWDERGVAPTGFMQGMALSFAQTYKRLKANHPAAIEMAKARTNSEKDVLNLWREEFEDEDMANETAGIDTLRHLYAFMLGSGMRESSGQHCCGRDQSADNVSSDTAEAGAFQTSYNASSASNPEFDMLMDEYLEGLSPGYLEAFSEGVSCSSSDWDNYGSGRGEQFQELCKNQPAFSAEIHALTLRNLCNHYGPVIRFEIELRSDADEMFKAVQDYMDSTEIIEV